MAIKSKSKPKKGKQVARAPRPTPVEVKPPLFLRKRVQVALALLAGIGLAALMVWITNGLRAERDQEHDRQVEQRARQVVIQYQGIVDDALKPVGQSIGPGMFDPFPQLTAMLGDLSKDTGDVKQAGDAGRVVAEAAAAASKAIGKAKVADLAGGKGLDGALVERLINSEKRLVQALDLFERAGRLLEEASAAPASERGRLIESATGVQEVAARLFTDGYTDYSETLRATGLFAQNPLTQLPQLGQ